MFKTFLKGYIGMSYSGTPMNGTEIVVFAQSLESLRRKLVVSDKKLFSSKMTIFVRKNDETIAYR